MNRRTVESPKNRISFLARQWFKASVRLGSAQDVLSQVPSTQRPCRHAASEEGLKIRSVKRI
jgi:hypothetical protein